MKLPELVLEKENTSHIEATILDPHLYNLYINEGQI